MEGDGGGKGREMGVEGGKRAENGCEIEEREAKVRGRVKGMESDGEERAKKRREDDVVREVEETWNTWKSRWQIGFLLIKRMSVERFSLFVSHISDLQNQTTRALAVNIRTMTFNSLLTLRRKNQCNL